MTTIEQLRAWRAHPNVAAFLRVLRQGESSQRDEAYRTIVGGTLFEDLSKHPGVKRVVVIGGRSITSSAAGAYQFLASTWAGLQRQYGFADFSREAQDLGAVALIAERGAIEPLLRGDFETAVARTCRVWASLPGSPYNQHPMTMERCLATFAQYGGGVSTQIAREESVSPAPIEDHSTTWSPPAAPEPSRSIFSRLADVWALFKYGRAIASGAALQNRVALGAAIVGILTTAASVAKGFGHALPLDAQQLEDVGNAVAVLVCLLLPVVRSLGSANAGWGRAQAVPADADPVRRPES